MGCTNSSCGCGKLTPSGRRAAWVALVAGVFAGFGTLAMAFSIVDDDKPAETKPAETKPAETKPAEDEAPKVDPYVLDHTMQDIDGSDVDLATFKGKVVLFVNVASKCGFTPQYEGLQKLYAEKKDKGLVIVGVPSNDFGKQEPGSNSDIKEVCTGTYKVTFPMMSKVVVKGEGQCGLYKDLTSQPSPVGGDVTWNFNKFLVDRAGNVVARYDSRTKPTDTEMLKKIDDLLGVVAGGEGTQPKDDKSSKTEPAMDSN